MGDLKATDGAGFAEELAATLDSLPEAQPRPLGFPVSAYLEVHIEQGPSLEHQGIPIGVVTGIQVTRWLDVVVTGQTAHAGTTALAYRRDPMTAVSQALAELYAAIMPGDTEARFTIGRISCLPGAVNAIPDTVRLTVDLRHPSSAVLDVNEELVRKTFETHADVQGCSAAVTRIFDMAPAQFPEPLLAKLQDAASDCGFATARLLSGAFHDALFMNRVAPSAMIFVPCRDGLSHNEAEHVEPDHCIAGCQALGAAVLKLAMV